MSTVQQPEETQETQFTEEDPALGLKEDVFSESPSPATEDEVQSLRSELDDVEKEVEHREWRITGKIGQMLRDGNVREVEFDRSYAQKPLSYLAMMQFTGLLGRKIDEAMSGPDGLTMQAVADMTEVAQLARGDGLSRTDFAGVDSFMRGFAKLASYVPEIIAEAQCIWLRIPYQERAQVIEVWSKPSDEGGLTMDDGEEMMTLFIRQNYEELDRFFVERSRRIAAVVQKERARLRGDDSPPSSS